MSSIRGIEYLAEDLNRLVAFFENEQEIAKFARDVLDGITPNAPYKTGRLQGSGHAYVGGKFIVGNGGDVRPIPNLYKPRNCITFMFRTPKPTGPRATVKYTDEHGEEVFDYSIKVLEAIYFYEGNFHPSKLMRHIDIWAKAAYQQWLSTM